MKSLCVYCGSSLGASPVYADTARILTKAMVDDNIAMPGGISTLEELFEVFPWSQLGLHAKLLDRETAGKIV